MKDIIAEKSDIEKLADIICGLHLSPQPDRIKATINPDLLTSRTDFDVTTTPVDVQARHFLYTKDDYYVRSSDLTPFKFRDTIMAQAHDLEDDKDYDGPDPFAAVTDQRDACGYRYFLASNHYLFLLFDKQDKRCLKVSY